MNWAGHLASYVKSPLTRLMFVLAGLAAMTLLGMFFLFAAIITFLSTAWDGFAFWIGIRKFQSFWKKRDGKWENFSVERDW